MLDTLVIVEPGYYNRGRSNRIRASNSAGLVPATDAVMLVTFAVLSVLSHSTGATSYCRLGRAFAQRFCGFSHVFMRASEQ